MTLACRIWLWWINIVESRVTKISYSPRTHIDARMQRYLLVVYQTTIEKLYSTPKIILRFCVLPNDDHLVYDTQSIFLYKGLSNFGLPSNLRHKVLDNVMTPASFISIVGVPISWVIHYLMLTTIFYAINMTDIFKSLMMNHGILQYMV